MLIQRDSIFQVLHIPARDAQGVGHVEDFQVLLFLSVFCFHSSKLTLERQGITFESV